MEGAHRVIAIERDARCLAALADISAAYPDRLTVHAGDALDTDFGALAANAPGDIAIAANLPYNIATLLLIGWLETEPWPPWWQRWQTVMASSVFVLALGYFVSRNFTLRQRTL
jgi:16S rRNA (adenine1518-N6/adenine1519-N6)-dimethyltransferase